MIKILHAASDFEIGFEITRFPDGTSQIWKLKESIGYFSDIRVLWIFEDEREFVSILQLGHLLRDKTRRVVDLYMPFLPYGRQDKETSTTSTFAKWPFLYALAPYYLITTYDAHSPCWQVKDIQPTEFFKHAMKDSQADLVCFPDMGAAERYLKMSTGLYTTAKKVRDQESGRIIDIEIDGLADLRGLSVLIVDDICDGGATFIALASKLKQRGVTNIHLAVSHGIFSKGKQILHDAGIDKIYTTNSLLKNYDGFDVIGLED